MTRYDPNQENLGDPVYKRVRERIRQDILDGVYPPGARIKTGEIGARYGVSQMPIREALQQLQGEGLVTIAPNRGASVRRVSADFIRHIYDIRSALESMLARRGVEVMTDADLFILYAIEGRFEDAVRRQDTSAALAANRELHETMYRLAGNPEAIDVLARHSELMQGLRRSFGYGPNRLEEIIAEHRRLLRAYDQRNCEEAARAIEEHCEKAKLDLIARAHFPAAAPARKRAGGERTPQL